MGAVSLFVPPALTGVGRLWYNQREKLTEREMGFMDQKKLAFGVMRLPLLDPTDTTKIDLEATNRMVDLFLERGFTYFDTAAPYHGGQSEHVVRECLVKRHPRESYTLTDKLSLFMLKEAGELEGFLAGQLERCGVDYFDYYLLHAMSKERLEQAEAWGVFDFVAQKKAAGVLRHVGFSFHDRAEVLEEILERHPEMEYVQLQLNYLDWEDPEVQSRKCYEVCRKHNKPVLVMEPVRGGLLTSLPQEAEAILKAKAPGASLTSWAVRFAASQEGVFKVLSGMSTLEQVEDNTAVLSDFRPLSREEGETLKKVVEIIHSKELIACTNCRYCVEGCPMGIAIPDYFKMMNHLSKFGLSQLPGVKKDYAQLTGEKGKGLASACVRCGQCEGACPQHLPVISHLESVAQTLE